MKTLAKITFLIVTAIFFTNTRSLAQCTPATSLPGYGIFPDSLAIATKNVAYQQVMQFESPTDTTVTVPVFGTVPAKIDSISIDSVVGMPTGFIYQCNKPKCLVKGGEIGCGIMSGTTSQTGNFPLNVYITSYGRGNVLGSWVAQKQQAINTHYSVVVKNATGIFEIIDHSLPIKVYPNPAQNKLFIDAKSVSSGTAVVKLFDLNGRLFSSELINVYNNPSIDISNLHAGIYFAEITDGAKVYRAKFVKE